MLNIFQIRIVANTNDVTWISNLQALPGTIAITWPPESGYSTGGTLSFSGAFTNITFGAADIESRVEGEMTCAPKGQPTVTPGTHP